MVNLKIPFIFLCPLFLVANAYPIDIPRTAEGRYYHLVPLSQQSLPLRRTVRDIFADSTDRVPPQVAKTTNEPNSKQEALIVGSSKSGDTEVTTQKKEILKPVYYDSTALFKISHRNRRASDRYNDNDNYYDDSDYAGYDRKGSEVGYMDKDDDFPTVVW